MIATLALFILSTALPLAAQQTQGPTVLAWTAHLAAERGQPELIPQIIPLLRHPHPDVQLAAADALIRMNADVPSSDLVGVRIDGSLDPVIVLLAKSPQQHAQLLMELIDQAQDDTQWAAINSILANAPPGGFAARLLHDWKLQILIELWDGPIGIGCRSSGSFRKPPPERDREGFPHKWVNVLSQGGSNSGTITITEEPFSVRYSRTKVARQIEGLTSHNESRKMYLQQLAHYGLPNTGVTFKWKSPENFLADAENLRALVTRCNTELRQILLSRGLLKPGEDTTGPAPEFAVTDMRHDKSTPLPKLSWMTEQPPVTPKIN